MSPLWKETTAIYKVVAKEGQIPHTISGWKCVHCNVEVWNRDVSRLAYHLAGDVSVRDVANGFTGIEVCAQVNSDVVSRAKMEIEFKVAKRTRKSSLSAAGQVVASEEGDLRAEHMQQTLTHLESCASGTRTNQLFLRFTKLRNL